MAGLSCGIVGLPNVGKSTLFNALTSSMAEAKNYPFCTIDPNIGIVDVMDPRLAILSDISKSKAIIHATMQFVDIAGLVAGASQGEGLGNKFLANIRETDAIVHVVRCFDSSDVIHVSGTVDPIRDIEIINLELILADLSMMENTLYRLSKQAKGKKELAQSVDLLERIKLHLDQSKPVRTFETTPEEKEILKLYPFLTNKKTLYVMNVSENDLPSMENDYVKKVRAYAENEGNTAIAICASLEAEIAQLPPTERKEFMDSLDLKQSGLDRLIKASYDMLGLISYLTTGEMETRAWTINEGFNAAEAAGKIHTDIQKGFIRAEVVSFEDIVSYKGREEARKAGKVRAEGKNYIVKDGDVILFLHN